MAAPVITIIQIYTNTDLRAGEDKLTQLIGGSEVRMQQKIGDVYLFINRARNIIKVLGGTGLYSERLPVRETYDLSLRKDKIFSAVGNAFGLKLVPAKGATV